MSAILGGYVQTAALNSTLENYVQASALSGYVQTSALTSTLANYVQTSALSGYVTNTSLSTTLSGYVTDTSLASTLASYATDTEVATALAAYVPKKINVADQSAITGNSLDALMGTDNDKVIFLGYGTTANGMPIQNNIVIVTATLDGTTYRLTAIDSDGVTYAGRVAKATTNTPTWTTARGNSVQLGLGSAGYLLVGSLSTATTSADQAIQIEISVAQGANGFVNGGIFTFMRSINFASSRIVYQGYPVTAQTDSTPTNRNTFSAYITDDGKCWIGWSNNYASASARLVNINDSPTISMTQTAFSGTAIKSLVGL
jgi:hypothetical protein